MRRVLLVWTLGLAAAGAAAAQERLEESIRQKLGRPYVWGATGGKAYDCSGFVWRSFLDAGVLLKRTTARKLFYSLPAAKPGERSRLGTLVFFNQVHHVGIIRNEREFYHASSTHGTTREYFGPHWQELVSGYRKVKTQ